jgi:hypothetical protein
MFWMIAVLYLYQMILRDIIVFISKSDALFGSIVQSFNRIADYNRIFLDLSICMTGILFLCVYYNIHVESTGHKKVSQSKLTASAKLPSGSASLKKSVKDRESSLSNKSREEPDVIENCAINTALQKNDSILSSRVYSFHSSKPDDFGDGEDEDDVYHESSGKGSFRGGSFFDEEEEGLDKLKNAYGQIHK